MAKNILFLFLIILGIDDVIASERCQIEIVVIENKQTIAGIEDWSLRSEMLDLKQAQTLIALPQTRYQLLNIVDKFKHSRDYRVVYHVAWEQRLKQDNYSKSVYITGGKNINFDDDSKLLSHEIEGVVSIMPSRNVFHTKVDFIFCKNRQHAEPLRFRLTNNGRLKQKELYYFDHPSFGLFVLVDPVSSEKFID